MRFLSWATHTLRIYNESLVGVLSPLRYSKPSLTITRTRLFVNSFATTPIATLHSSEEHFIRRDSRYGKCDTRIEGVRKQLEAKINDRRARDDGHYNSASDETSLQKSSIERNSTIETTSGGSIEDAPARSASNIDQKAKAEKRKDVAEPRRTTSNSRAAKLKESKEQWKIQKDALKSKFGEEGWNPRKKLSPDAMEGIRAMNAQYPDQFTTPVLAKQFGVSPEAIRRILKSKWRPSADEAEKRNARWDRRGERIWGKFADMGLRPPKKWREMGVGKVKDGQAPKWSREYRRSRHPENIYDAPRKADGIIARRSDATIASAAPRQNFVDRIR